VWVSKVSELIGSSPLSFEDAARGSSGAPTAPCAASPASRCWRSASRVEDDRVVEYRVRLRLSFDMAPEAVLHW
jgi:flavin-binding protein dodecin